MPPTLVVLGTKTDAHVERVVNKLQQIGAVDVFVLDYHDDTRYSLDTDENGQHYLRVNSVLLPNRYLVWDRTKILPGTELYIRGDERSSGYMAQEWRALYKLICGLNRGNVLNSLESRVCMIKPYQQIIAARAGFLVPPSVVSNSKDRIVDFQNENDGKTIMKSLSGGKVKPAGEGEAIPYNVMTMRVTLDDVANSAPEQISICPHFFQREIEKSYELRVVVVGEEILAFRIDSQQHKMSEVDWRKGIFLVPFSRCDIEPALQEKITRFMRLMGLFCGSLDLIADVSGRSWFLECNQDGAWGWLDDIAGGAVTEAYANEFKRRLMQMPVALHSSEVAEVA